MELDNDTPFPAAIFRGILDQDRLFGSVAARVTFALGADGLAVAPKQVWKVSPGPWDCDYGPMEPDELFYRGGVDIFVLGSARPPGAQPATRVDVTVNVGAQFQHTISVFGDRVWEKHSGQIVITPPRPFEAVLLTLMNAFGGKDEWDELPISFPDNPVGKGYYIEPEHALGKPLPNIENPYHPIVRWSDRPEPAGVGLCPSWFGPRTSRNVVCDQQNGTIREIKPAFFNAAFPDMVAKSVVPGDIVRVDGVRPEGPARFSVPDLGLRVRLELGDEVIERTPSIDQIGIEVDQKRVFISYRYPFRYRLIPLQRRSCTLEWDGG